MNADELKAKTEKETDDAVEYRDDIKKLLVMPSKAIFECLDRDDCELWIVGTKDEYILTFDETSESYGLAFRNIMNSMVYLGSDGAIGDAYHTLVTREEDTDRGNSGRSGRKPQKRTDANPFFRKKSRR